MKNPHSGLGFWFLQLVSFPILQLLCFLLCPLQASSYQSMAGWLPPYLGCLEDIKSKNFPTTTPGLHLAALRRCMLHLLLFSPL